MESHFNRRRRPNMTRPRAIVGCVVMLVVTASIGLMARAQPATTLPATLPGDQRPGPAPVGRGRGIPGAPLYVEHCQGCHGTDLSGGRADSLFREKWLTATADSEIIQTVRNGLRGTEMGPF